MQNPAVDLKCDDSTQWQTSYSYGSEKMGNLHSSIGTLTEGL